MSTSSLIWPSFTIWATIWEKVFDLKNYPKLNILQDRVELDMRSNKENTPHISIGEEIFLFIAAINCSLLEFNTLITIPHTLGLQAEHEIQGRSNKMLQRKKLLPSLMSGVTFHSVCYVKIISRPNKK